MPSRLTFATILGASTALCVAMTCCGGIAEVDDGSAGATRDGGRDGSRDGNASSGPCVSPHGYAVCGGSNDCFPPDAEGPGTDCPECGLYTGATDYAPNLCFNDAVSGKFPDGRCNDDCVYVKAVSDAFFQPFPFEVAKLYLDNGATTDRVRYADYATWTGASLPPIASCDAGAIETCGGSCAPCPGNEQCTGRSPLHPLGLCVPQDLALACHAPKFTCPSGDGCFVFTVDADAQADADQWGACLPLDRCRASAAILPGGGTCHEGT